MNKKIASEIAIGIILLVAIVVGGIFYWQSTKVPVIAPVVNNQQPVVNNQQEQLQSATNSQLTQINNDAIATPENWKTYSNGKLGFGLSYPNDWFVFDDSESKAIVFQNYNKRVTPETVPNGFESFIITYDQKQIANPVGPEPNFKTLLSVNGIQIKHSKDSAGPGGSEWTINGVNYLMLYSSPNPSDEEIDVMNKVVRTLMPVNASTDETANWQTYTNAKYGFEFKYPKDYLLEDESGSDCGIVNIKKSSTTGASIYGSFSVTCSQEKIDKDNDKKTTINGYKAYIITNGASTYEDSSKNGLTEYTEYKIFDNNNQYDVFLNNDDLTITKEILSTFKFTK